MPWWDDIISQLERDTCEPNGLLWRSGVERADDRQRLENAIRALADWTGQRLTRQAIAKAMFVDGAVVNDMARRANADLIAPALALEAVRSPDQHLTLAVIRGRVGEVREADVEAGPVGVHNRPGWAAHECLAGWALVTASKEPALVLEMFGPVLLGTIDDPEHAGELADELGYVPRHDRPVAPADLVLGQRDRLAQVDRAARRLAGETIRARETEAMAKLGRVERHAGLVLIADVVPFGFVKQARLADDTYDPAGHWRPGLDGVFLDGLMGGRPWAAYALRGDHDVLRPEQELQRMGDADNPRHWGRGFVRALADGQIDGPVIRATAGSTRVRRIRRVHVHGRAYDLLVHDGRHHPLTGWTIDADATEEQAELLATTLCRHLEDLDGAAGIHVLARGIDQRYGLLRVGGSSYEMRAFLRALALAGDAARAAGG